MYLCAEHDYGHGILRVFRMQVGTRIGDTVMKERLSFVWKAWLCICNLSSVSLQVLGYYDGLEIKHCSILVPVRQTFPWTPGAATGEITELAGPLVWNTMLIFVFLMFTKLSRPLFLQNRHSKFPFSAVSRLWSLLPAAPVTLTFKQVLGVMVSLYRTWAFRLMPDEIIHRS